MMIESNVQQAIQAFENYQRKDYEKAISYAAHFQLLVLLPIC